MDTHSSVKTARQGWPSSEIVKFLLGDIIASTFVWEMLT